VRFWIVMLPVVALALVGGAAAVALMAQDVEPAPASGPPTPGPTETPAATRPQLEPEGTVCQGILHVPEPGRTREFPDEYTQVREVLGFAVVAGPDVPPEALDVAAQTLEAVFADPELRAPLVEKGAYVAIAAPGERPQDLPEFKCLEEELGQTFGHLCGIADRADYPIIAVSASDLLGDENGPCRGLNILYHEIGHFVHGWVISPADYIDTRLFYQRAIDEDRYRGDSYALTSPGEYFAEGTQAYFWENDRDPRNRMWLRMNDPDLYELLQGVYGE
jgi:hypothetical protein